MFSVRSIFLLVRGIDQTGRALTEPKKKLNELEQAQRNLAASGTRLLFAGAAFTTFAFMAGRALFSLLETTSLGQIYMGDFERTFERVKAGLADAILDKFGPTLEGWIKQLDDLSKNETWLGLIGGTAVNITLALGEIGLIMAGAGLGLKLLDGLVGILLALKFEGAAAGVLAGGQMGITLIIAAYIGFKIAGWFWEKSGMREINEEFQKQVEAQGYEVKFTPGFPKVIDPSTGRVIGAKELNLMGLTGSVTVNQQNYYNITGMTELELAQNDSVEGLVDVLGNIKP